ncbi:MAG: outer membrane protein OmpA-like peptidoglycan-associated protein [Candidatus Azotimanducaceae bacterium]|jgi:outer membrane protein OmpA-like peptidoglycan-associated protein
MSESIFGKSKPSHSEEGDHWLSISDLMAGLMIVFLFISVVLMHDANKKSKTANDEKDVAEKSAVNFKNQRNKFESQRDQIKEIAAAYQANKVDIYNALIKEFRMDLLLWEAEIVKDDLSFNFKSPEVLFGIGKITLKPKFKEIIDDFFPRYLNIIDQFKGSIEEVRIEGHTSSRWNSGVSEDEAYFKNMGLSQGRTRSVLSYIHGLDLIAEKRIWITANVAAVGYSSSKLIITNGVEDSERSRRVTFKLVTNSETQILKIIGK